MLPIDVASLFCGQGEHGSFPALDLYVPSGQAIQKKYLEKGVRHVHVHVTTWMDTSTIHQ